MIWISNEYVVITAIPKNCYLKMFYHNSELTVVFKELSVGVYEFRLPENWILA